MRVLVSERNKLCLFWSPKAGCSTATKIFLEHEGFAFDKDIWIHKERERYQREIHPAKLPFHPGSFKKIQFTRNPYQRSVCSYLLNLEHHRKSDKISFSKSGLENFLLLKARGEIKCRHCEFHSCAQFMTDEIDMVVRIENLEQDIPRANQLFGLNLNPQIQYHPHSFRKKIDAAGLDSNKTYEGLLDCPRVRSLIDEIYKRDFKFIEDHSIKS